MSLASGTRLGPYEIVALIGAGGMGEVYRARDPRLGRDVAIKVLPTAFSTDPDRLRRFEQEARAAAALNHPNILAVYDIGTHNGAPYIVSELLEGETLRDRLAKQAKASAGATPALTKDGAGLPVRKAVDYAVQVSHGLAAAHEKGILHRDLKPENLFVTADGRVKILDFGLAKLTEGEAALAGVSNLPTEPVQSEPGMLLGTMGYMSPEQVRGQTADHRSDIFAFGAVLYEMLSGQRAFRGATVADTISAILDKDPPDLPVAERHIPPAVERIVDRCVEKTPAARFQTASDLGFALEALSSQWERSDVSAAVAASPARVSREKLAWALLAVVLVAGLAFGATQYFGRAPADTRVQRSTLLPPPNVTFTLPAALRLALSPDGRRLAFAAAGADGRSLLWVRPLDGLVAQPLTGTESAAMPFWSPDSRFIGFFAGGKLKKIDAAGGPPLTLCDFSGAPAGASWNRDDVILFTVRTGPDTGPIRRVSASGGAPSIVAAPDPKSGETEYWSPFFLPDGRHFLYLALATEGTRPLGIYVASLDSKERKLLVRGGSNMKYAQGYLMFLRDATLMAQALDVKRLELSGDAVPIADQVQLGNLVGGANGAFTASDTGVLAYQAGAAGARSQLVWFDRAGKQIGMLGEQGDYGDVELSPDGTRAAISLLDPASRTRDIWLFDVARDLRTRFTFDPADELASVWSPDGSRVVFNSRRKGRLDLFQKAASGAGNEDVLLSDSLADKYPKDWSPDGRFLLCDAQGTATGGDLWILPLFGDRKPFSFLQTQFNELRGQFSPDGRWVAYQSDQSGRNEVYVAPFPGPGGKWQVSTAGGTDPRWRRDGKGIFYLAGDNKLMVAAVNGQGSAVEVGAVRPLFELRPRIGVRNLYAVSADGQRFLVNTLIEQSGASPITLVVNWTAGLKK